MSTSKIFFKVLWTIFKIKMDLERLHVGKRKKLTLIFKEKIEIFNF